MVLLKVSMPLMKRPVRAVSDMLLFIVPDKGDGLAISFVGYGNSVFNALKGRIYTLRWQSKVLSFVLFCIFEW